MGDRCYIQLTVRESDVGFFTSSGFYIDMRNGDGTVRVVDEERNYGDVDSFQHMPFFGSHHTGCEYGPSAMACDGKGRFVSVDSDFYDNDIPVVKYGSDGISPDALRSVEEYYSVLAAARVALGLVEKGAT